MPGKLYRFYIRAADVSAAVRHSVATPLKLGCFPGHILAEVTMVSPQSSPTQGTALKTVLRHLPVRAPIRTLANGRRLTDSPQSTRVTLRSCPIYLQATGSSQSWGYLLQKEKDASPSRK